MKRSFVVLLLILLLGLCACEATPSTVVTRPDSAVAAVVGNAYGYLFLTEGNDLYSYGKIGVATKIYMLGVADAQTVGRPTKILTDVVSITDNFTMPAAITSNGDLYVWGYNGAAMRLGLDPATEIVWEPTMIMQDVARVGYGYAIKTNGDLYIWGSYANVNPLSGEFSAGSPYKKMGGVVKCSLSMVSYALKADGSLWSWGCDTQSAGTRGNGLFSAEDSGYDKPVKILDDVRDFSASGSHVLAVKTDGSLWAWGNNEYGQIGVGTTGDQSAITLDAVVTQPIKILDAVATVTTTLFSSFAVASDGRLYGWGRNLGQILGESSATVAAPCPLASDVASVCLPTLSRIFALTVDGRLLSWGEYGYGSLGTGQDYDYEALVNRVYHPDEQKALLCSSRPTPVCEGISRFLGGYELLFAQTDDGGFVYWGFDRYKTVETYGEANYIVFSTNQYHCSDWYRCDYAAPLPLDDAAQITDAVCYDLVIVPRPAVCEFPPDAA